MDHLVRVNRYVKYARLNVCHGPLPPHGGHHEIADLSFSLVVQCKRLKGRATDGPDHQGRPIAPKLYAIAHVIAENLMFALVEPPATRETLAVDPGVFFR